MSDDVILSGIVVLALAVWGIALSWDGHGRPRRVRVWPQRRPNRNRRVKRNRNRRVDNAQVYEANAQLAQALTVTRQDNADLRAQLDDVSERLDLARVFVLMWMQRHAAPSDSGWRVVNEEEVTR